MLPSCGRNVFVHFDVTLLLIVGITSMLSVEHHRQLHANVKCPKIGMGFDYVHTVNSCMTCILVKCEKSLKRRKLLYFIICQGASDTPSIEQICPKTNKALCLDRPHPDQMMFQLLPPQEKGAWWCSPWGRRPYVKNFLYSNVLFWLFVSMNVLCMYVTQNVFSNCE